MPFLFCELEIPGVILIQTRRWADRRGAFTEMYKASEFSANGVPERFVQDNFSYSRRHVLRGLHYQKHPAAQGKLVMVLHGEIFDVAVDIRKGSPTYGKWVGAFLSFENRSLLYVPPGFAHGFCVVSQEARVVYKVTAEYSPKLERGIAWNDSDVNVQWPICDPILSGRDAELPPLRAADHNFTIGLPELGEGS